MAGRVAGPVIVLALLGLRAASVAAQTPTLSPAVRAFVSVDAPVVALTHARVIDGTGAPARDDQTLIIERGVVRAVGAAASTPAPAGAKVIDLTGQTVLPGLVMVHEHMFYPTGGVPIYAEQGFSFPRLYLAGGATTIRTGGSVEPYTDLNLRKFIDTGLIPGPAIDVTGPYLDGPDRPFYQFHTLTGPDDAVRMVQYWSDQGATSFKAYMGITRAELGAAIGEAHKRGLKVTGHLCSVTFREAAELGIDDLEHGLVVATDFVPGKQPDLCPTDAAAQPGSIVALDLQGQPAQDLIHTLVQHHVAVTSTLTVFETFTPRRPPLSDRVLETMLPDARIQYLRQRARIGEAATSSWTTLLAKEMQFERAFAAAGGLLLSGTDPTGYGGVVAGFSNQREVELLVEAGFTPLEAIKVATLNGAQFLGRADKVGSIAVGKAADLMVVRGNPAATIADIEQVLTVFKDGVGYDPALLIASARGAVGLH
ncbi:MAG TPA: amidohydrolase family protein [Gemmatimonadales bacterium]